jgi:hypothetical protein
MKKRGHPLIQIFVVTRFVTMRSKMYASEKDNNQDKSDIYGLTKLSSIRQY